MAQSSRFRYEELADLVTGLVAAGTLPVGSRAPSLREISAQQRTSLTTALQAYRLLEDRGVLEARPKSGFFVARAGSTLPVPAKTRPSQKPVDVAASRIMLQLLEHASNPALAPLGCAIPGQPLLASARLDRILARTARSEGVALNTYSVPRGELALRVEIARRALRFGQALSPDEIAITCGCTEALALALRSVTRPGDAVAIESPTYHGLLQVLRSLGLRAIELPTDARTGVDLDALRAAVDTRKARACVLASSFSNPLGYTVPEEDRAAVIQLLGSRGIPLIEDDVYGDLHFGSERPRPFSAIDTGDNTIYCGSFSKTLSPGYRIGWIATRRHMETVLENKFASTLCGPTLPQIALAQYLSSGGYDHHLRRLRGVFSETLRCMSHAIERAFPVGTRVSRPAGGFVLWVELPKALDCRVLFAQALQEGICFAPGVIFSASGAYSNCLRLSGGHGWSEQVEGAVARLGALACQAVRELPARGAA